MGTTVNIYLTFDGKSEEAFNFYKSVFGGEFAYVGRFKDMPAGSPIPESSKEKIMHISLPISKETILMASDTMPGYSPALVQGNNYTITVTPESEEEAKRIYNALSSGGKVIMPLEKTFWDALYGMFTDKFGIQWAVNYEYNKH